MSLFDIFRCTTKQLEVQHSVFGRIVCQEDDTWEFGKAVFSPAGHEVEVIIRAGVSGPTEAHERFWRELSNRWPKIKIGCEPLLRRALVNWVKAPESGDIWSRLKLECLDVYPDEPPDEWELAFLCEEAGHWPTISMKRWTPTDCFVDG